MKFIRKITLLTALLCMFMTPLVVGSTVAAADAKTEVCSGITGAGGGCGGSNGNSLSHTVANVVNLISILAGIIAVIVIIVTGIRFITSGGDASGVAAAKSGLIYALVGLVIVALAQFIVHFVLGRAAGVQ